MTLKRSKTIEISVIIRYLYIIRHLYNIMSSFYWIENINKTDYLIFDLPSQSHLMVIAFE